MTISYSYSDDNTSSQEVEKEGTKSIIRVKRDFSYFMITGYKNTRVQGVENLHVIYYYLAPEKISIYTMSFFHSYESSLESHTKKNSFWGH